MCRLTDGDAGQPVEDPVERDSSLRSSQRRARAGVVAASESHVLANVGAVYPEGVKILELPRVAIACPGQQHHRASDGIGTSPIEVDVRAIRKWDLTGLSSVVSLRRRRDAVALLAQQCLDVGTFSDDLHAEAEQLGDGFLAGREQEGGEPDDVDDVGSRAVEVFRLGQFGQHIPARLSPAFGDVGREFVVQPLQRIVRPVSTSSSIPPTTWPENKARNCS